MRRLLPGLAVLALVSPAAAQTAAPRFDAAPWWMSEPVIASIGYVEVELWSNRATFGASFRAVDRNPAVASTKAIEQVRTLIQTLGAYGADKVRVTSAFGAIPIYEQYRDRSGNLQSNERGDQIDAYQASVDLDLEVRDVSLIQRIYAAVLAANPTEIEAVNFSFEASDDLRSELSREAVADASRRAAAALAASNGRLGGVRLIDPTGRACEPDVLVTGATRGSRSEGLPTRLQPEQ